MPSLSDMPGNNPKFLAFLWEAAQREPIQLPPGVKMLNMPTYWLDTVQKDFGPFIRDMLDPGVIRPSISPFRSPGRC